MLTVAAFEVVIRVEPRSGTTPALLRMQPPGYPVEPLGLSVEEEAIGRVRLLLDQAS
ncbi:MAG: hypothetical protein M3O00_11590 [Pseudomonadota bacterium]|nr:hypothetical protein [Pseudomonadota bacterium]